MKTREFDFELPNNLVAQHPPQERGQSRLMVLDRATGARTHKMINDLPEILCDEKHLLVFNDTRVRKARLIGRTDTGKEEEILLLNAENAEYTEWKAIVKRTKRKKIGNVYNFSDIKAVIKNIENDCLMIKFDHPIDDEWLDKNGHVPLPPYIKRKDEITDSYRYQTIYAKQTGSVAAPTAGLHFTKEILDRLAANGIENATITLHVGLGTFLPVRCENIEDHKMHEEQFIITEENAQKIEKAKNEGRKIMAVGTTSLRTLESAFLDNKLKRGRQSTSIFIYPGYKFKVVDALFTNFHTPLSTLLMLVCSFAGKDLIMESYAEAIRKEYRFFSYGDAMLIL